MIESHLFLMICEVLAVLVVVLTCLGRFSRRQIRYAHAPMMPLMPLGHDQQSPSPPPPPPQPQPSSIHLQDKSSDRQKRMEQLKEGRRRKSGASLVMHRRADVVENLPVFHDDDDDHQPPASPAPSAAGDSSSSGCESAFSFPNSANDGADCVDCGPPSRDPSPSLPISSSSSSSAVQSKHSDDAKRNHKKKRKLSLQADVALPKASPPKIRLKSDNWEWHSRAKVLAAAFIKENYESIGARTSV